MAAKAESCSQPRNSCVPSASQRTFKECVYWFPLQVFCLCLALWALLRAFGGVCWTIKCGPCKSTLQALILPDCSPCLEVFHRPSFWIVSAAVGAPNKCYCFPRSLLASANSFKRCLRLCHLFFRSQMRMSEERQFGSASAATSLESPARHRARHTLQRHKSASFPSENWDQVVLSWTRQDEL
jgi:hypothetical protein